MGRVIALRDRSWLEAPEEEPLIAPRDRFRLEPPEEAA
jgi:hypothetical protein